MSCATTCRTPINICDMIRGTDWALDITIYVDEVVQNLAGYTFYFTLKDKLDNDITDDNAIYKTEWTEPATPDVYSTTLLVTSANTQDIPNSIYKWDIKYKDSSGNIQIAVFGEWIVGLTATNRN